MRKRPGYLFKYSRRGVRVIVGSHVRACVRCVCTQVSLRFFRGVSRRFRYRCIEFRVHVEEFIVDELCSLADARMCVRLHACHSRSLSLSLFPLSSRIRRVAAFFSLDFPPRSALLAVLSSRVSSAHIKDYIRAGCLAHIGAG